MTPRERWEALRDALDELEGAEKSATDGPWDAYVLGSEGYELRATRPPQERRLSRARLARFGYETWETDRANAEMVALLRNAAPALLATARQVVEAHHPRPGLAEPVCNACCVDFRPDPWPCPDIAPLLPLIGGDQ